MSDLRRVTVVLSTFAIVLLATSVSAQDTLLVLVQRPPPPEFTLTRTQEFTVARMLNPGQQVQLTRIAQRLADTPSSGTIRTQWEALVGQVGGSEPDINALVQSVLSQAYNEANDDLRQYAEKVAHFNEMKEGVRSEIGRLRDALDDHMRGAAWTDFRPDMSFWSSIPEVNPPAAISSPDVADSWLAEWEKELARIGDDAQLANIDLQSALQKQQQTLQMMSNISKMLHDTAMAVIRKIGN